MTMLSRYFLGRAGLIPEPWLVSHVTMRITPQSITSPSLMQVERDIDNVHLETSFPGLVMYPL